MTKPRGKNETIGTVSRMSLVERAAEIQKRRTMPTKKKAHPFGPVTTSLKPMAQRFVEIVLTYPHIPQYQALRKAGHHGKATTVERAAGRLMHDPVILEAIKEGAVAKLNGMVPKVLHALEDIVDDPKSRHHFKAVDGILNRAGLPEVKETKQTVVHTVDRTALVTSIAQMVERLGMNFHAGKLLPQPVVTEGDVVEAQVVDTND